MTTQDDMNYWAKLAVAAASVNVKPEQIKFNDKEVQEAIDLIVCDEETQKLQQRREKLKQLNLPMFFDRPLLGKILVLPRSSAREFTYDKPWACISIASAQEELPKINAVQRLGLLQLTFADLDAAASQAFRDIYPELADRLFTAEQARQIRQFVQQYWNDIDLLMIHCYAGISRSSAVGKALSDEYQPAFSEWFAPPLFTPNRLVYSVHKDTIQEAQNEHHRTVQKDA